MVAGLAENVAEQIVSLTLSDGVNYSHIYDLGSCTWIETANASAAPTDAGHTPTLATVFETSVDGVTYATLVTHTAATTSAVAYNTQAANRLSGTPGKLGRYGRWKWTVGSASLSPGYVVTASMVAGA